MSGQRTLQKRDLIAPMIPEPTPPKEERVKAACRKFDEENAVSERALADLFRQYPTNDNEAHVLLQVVALNRLCFANIFAVHNVARHIYDHASEIDLALSS